MKPDGKIEILTYGGKEVPTVKFFGEVDTKDIIMTDMQVRRTYFSEYLPVIAKEEREKQKELLQEEADKLSEENKTKED